MGDIEKVFKYIVVQTENMYVVVTKSEVFLNTEIQMWIRDQTGQPVQGARKWWLMAMCQSQGSSVIHRGLQ